MSYSKERVDVALLVQQILLSCIIAANGWARWLSDAVEAFAASLYLLRPWSRLPLERRLKLFQK